MTDKEIYQQIEEHSEEAHALYERIHEQVETSIVKHAEKKKRRKKLFVASMSIAVALVVTLAITLPIVLQPQEQEIRYSDANVLLHDALDCNLKEYSAVNNLPLLYLDWYENAAELSTVRFYEEGKEGQTVYWRETWTDEYWGYPVRLFVMKRNIVVESLEEMIDEYETTIIGDTQIVYILHRNYSLAKFEYQGYKYYLEIRYGLEFDFLVETIESMFNN